MDLTFLTSIHGTTGPVASLNINSSRDAEDADHEVRVRWSKARADLRSQGADEETLTAMEAVVGETKGVAGPHGHVVFAADGQILAQDTVTEFPQDYRARVGPLPDPLLYLYSESPRIAHVLAVIDSVGGDLRVVQGDGRVINYRVEGEDWPVQKVRGAAYHHNQLQRAVDNQVADNAGRVAGAIANAVRYHGAEVVGIAGEVQIRGEVRVRLPEWAEEKAVDLEAGARHAGAGRSPLEEELQEVLLAQAQRQTAEALASLEQGRANRDRVAEGLTNVVYALQRGQVQTLLWSTANTGAEERLWFGPAAEQLALTDQELRDMGVTQPVQELAGPVLLRAAAAGAAELLLIPQQEDTAQLSGGLGALLRFDDPNLSG